MEEESSSPEEGSPLRSGSRDSTTATQQGHDDEHDIKMRDVGDVPNPPQGTATQTDPPPETMEDDPESKKDVVVEDKRIIIEGGGVTPITPADDQLLDLDDQEDPTGAETPSRAVTESLSQMNMDSPTSTLTVSDPLVVTRKLKRSPWLRVTSLTQFELKFMELY